MISYLILRVLGHLVVAGDKIVEALFRLTEASVIG